MMAVMQALREYLLECNGVTQYFEDASIPGAIEQNKSSEGAPDTRIVFDLVSAENVGKELDSANQSGGLYDWTIDLEVRSFEVELCNSLASEVFNALENAFGDWEGVNVQAVNCQTLTGDYEPLQAVDMGLHLIPIQITISGTLTE